MWGRHNSNSLQQAREDEYDILFEAMLPKPKKRAVFLLLLSEMPWPTGLGNISKCSYLRILKASAR